MGTGSGGDERDGNFGDEKSRTTRYHVTWTGQESNGWERTSKMSRIIVFVYGVMAYIVFLGVFLYLIGFLGNFIVPKSVDSTPSVSMFQGILVNALLIVLFGVQHSVMARPTFKQWWSKNCPQPVERITYVMLTNVALILLFWLWQSIEGEVWSVQNPIASTILWGVFALGWLTVLGTTFLINHFDLFGLRQTWLYLRGQEYTSLGFVTPGPYKFVRHPLYVGWLLAFWATPHMTVSHLVFSIGTTAYILIAIPLEERNLAEFLGEKYTDYRRSVPMLIPSLSKRNDG